MATAASGPLSKPLDHLRTLIANSSTFQTWTSTADAAAAKARVYVSWVDFDNATRPFAVVGFPPGGADEREAYAGGTRNYFLPRGVLEMQFEAAISESGADDALYEFTNQIGAIISEMEDLSASSGYLVVRRFSIMDGPARSDKAEGAEGTNFYQITYSVEWGI